MNRVKRQPKPKSPASSQKPSLKLTPGDVETICDELIAYHHLFHSVFQRREQRYWSMFYLCGQLSNMERKTIEPMVLNLHGPDPNVIRAVQQFIGQGQWKAQALIARHQQIVADLLEEPDGVVIIDGSGFPKQGHDSVGVARQYCGNVGKVANSQEGVFAVYASQRGYTFLDVRLYLPQEWFEADHRDRWQKCGIPDRTPFQTEPELALAMVRDLAKSQVIAFKWVTCDEQFGRNPAFLGEIAALGKWYLAEVPCDTRVWLRTPRVEPAGPGVLGRLRKRARVAKTAPRPRELRTLAAELPRSAWTRYVFKQGSKGPMVAEFAVLRVTMIRDGLPGPRVWAMVRRRLGEDAELKFYLSNAPLTCTRRKLAYISGMRWPIETALEDGKDEIGMDEYETRTWDGWYHHMAQTFMAHLFLVRMGLKFKKSAGPDDCPSPRVGRVCS